MYTNGESIIYRSDRPGKTAAAGRTAAAGHASAGRTYSVGPAAAADRSPTVQRGYGDLPAEQPEARPVRLEAAIDRLEGTITRLEWAVAGLAGAVAGLEGRVSGLINPAPAVGAGGSAGPQDVAEAAPREPEEAPPARREVPQEPDAEAGPAAGQPHPRVSLYAGSGATATPGQVRIQTEDG